MLSAVSVLSGMAAASIRTSVAASNIANVNSNGPLASFNQANSAPPAYQPLRVEQTSAAGANGATATKAVVQVSPGTDAAYEPNASHADEQGFVATPNVDILNELLNLTLASQDYLVNAKVSKTINDLVRSVYDLGNG
jgi:flagellar basal-body rod protein FlgC